MIHEVRSPIPGIFYRRPAPDADPYVDTDDKVTADSTIGLVEVMKQFHEINAGVDGVVEAFHVDDAGMVGPGQVIVTVTVES